jgi:hypothetical protein
MTPNHTAENRITEQIPCDLCEGIGSGSFGRRGAFEQIEDARGKKKADVECPVCRGLGFIDYASAVLQAVRIEELEEALIATGKLVPVRSYRRLSRDLQAIPIETFDYCCA